MKKILPIVVVVALVAAAAIFFLRQQGSPNAAPGRAAALAPADAVVFIEFPDAARSKVRWKDTSLHKIAEEPEWREFTAKWDAFAAQNAEWKEVSGVFGQIERADPAGVFVAMTAFDGPVPKMVGGFSYRGKKSDVQAVVSAFRTKLLDAYPTAKAGDLTSYEGTEIETLKDKEITFSMAYRDNWFLFATDTELLLKTLSRYVGKPGAPASLASDAAWKKAIAHGASDPDVTVFVRWTAVEKQIQDALALASGQVVPSEPSGMESILYTGKMDGLLMRDRLYFALSKKLQHAYDTCANRMSAFSSAATYAYMATQMAPAGADRAKYAEVLSKTPVGKEADTVLAKKGLKIADIYETFGPEIGMLSDWESGGLSLPTFFAAVEVRDVKKARLFAELMIGELSDAKKPAETAEGGVTFWTFPAELGFLQPTFALTDKHLMFGLNSATVKAALKQAKADGGKVVARADFQTAAKTVVSPSMMVLYVDFKTLFERLYEKLKPMAAYAMVGDSEAAKYFDPTKLPKAETISRHLLPMMIGSGVTDGGMVLDCTGSLSFIQSYVPLLGGAFFVRSPVLVPRVAPAGANNPPAGARGIK